MHLRRAAEAGTTRRAIAAVAGSGEDVAEDPVRRRNKSAVTRKNRNAAARPDAAGTGQIIGVAAKALRKNLQ